MTPRLAVILILAGYEVPIALTGRVGAGEEAACPEAGCNRFLAKPVAAADLLEELAVFIDA